jgi:hypothetical protein
MKPNREKTENIAVPCPECGEVSMEPAERIVENDVLPCSLCGGLIDLAAEGCTSLILHARTRLNNER